MNPLLIEKYREATASSRQLESEIVMSKELLDQQWPNIRRNLDFEIEQKPSKKPNNSGVLTPADILDGVGRSLRSVPCGFVRRSVPKYTEYETLIVWYRAELDGEVVNIAWEQSGTVMSGPDYFGVFRGGEDLPHYVGNIKRKVPKGLPRKGDFSESAWRQIPEAWWLFALLANRTLYNSDVVLDEAFFDADAALQQGKRV
eukprot:TRINITY_DN18352_c0_g1_i1.p1 TRINITY_DN18352_c0_g1~~TRINITY_DN18352_c0_g1_i1.p1  ORF type:complete len:201 (-),score=27.11 TRINITY_DN18352_c0_g1_i1:321-923(-)